VFYFTSFTFRNLLLSFGFDILHFESVPYPLENSLLAVVRNTDSLPRRIEPEAAGLRAEIERARGFAELVFRRRETVRTALVDFRKMNPKSRIVLFGAGHLSVAFLSIMGLEDLVDFVIDDNRNKKGMEMPVGELAIKGSEDLYSEDVALCLLGLNPHNQPNVIAKHKEFERKGGVFASIFPGGERYLEDIL